MAENWGGNEQAAFDYERYNAPRQGGQESGQESLNEGGASMSAPVWAGQGRKYEWNEEMGDVAPRDEQLEKELFKDSSEVIDFSK